MSDEQHAAPRPAQSSLGIPVAIVIAAALIAGAIIYSGAQKTAAPTALQQPNGAEQVTPEAVVEPVTDADHIQGNPNAPIVIVEYSDYDCPFCKNFHDTMKGIMSEFGADGKVAWVYRHFPLTQLHPNAPKIAEASECVAELGGNEAFWEFSDLVFGERAVNAQTDIMMLPGFAEQSGVNKDAFNTCLSSGKYTKTIADDLSAAMKTGARGTPYSFVIVGDEKVPINGAQDISTVRQIILSALAS